MNWKIYLHHVAVVETSTKMAGSIELKARWRKLGSGLRVVPRRQLGKASGGEELQIFHRADLLE
jgi:hypothetical protein